MRRLQNIAQAVKSKNPELVAALAAIQREFDNVYRNMGDLVARTVTVATAAAQAASATAEEATSDLGDDTTSSAAISALQTSVDTLQSALASLTYTVSLLPVYHETTGMPPDTLGKDGDYAWGTTTEKWYDKTGGSWQERG